MYKVAVDDNNSDWSVLKKDGEKKEGEKEKRQLIIGFSYCLSCHSMT